MTLEAKIREMVEILRARGHAVTYVTDAAIVDGPCDDRGRLPANPDMGAGEEPGRELVTVDGRLFPEEFFTRYATPVAMADAVEATLR